MSQSHRVFVLGDGGVGKTALIATLTGTGFPRSYHPTFGFRETVATIRDVVYTLVDISGQEKFASPPNTAQAGNCDLGLLVYDPTSRISQRNLANWRRDLLANTGCTKILCLKTKTDIGAEKTTAILGEIPISARSGQGMDTLMARIQASLPLTPRYGN